MNTPRPRLLFGAITFLLIAACNSAFASDLACTPTTQIPLSAIKVDVIAIGEFHGSNEIPAFVEGLVCQIALTGKPVVLGLELPMDLQADITKYTLSRGEVEDKKALLSASFWQDKMQDGRTSVAMFKLIDLVRRLRNEGKDVLLSAYDSRSSDDIVPLTRNEPRAQARRDSIMATNIYDRLKQYPGYTHIVLAGNGHIGKFKQQDWNPAVSSMAYLLQQRVPVYAISFSFLRGGESWACHTPDAPCGPGPVTASTATTLEGFDLIVPIEKLTASFPAKDMR
ncbi:hypothetical protein ACO0K9_23720 [Undibacterium sp. Ji50W]|uniref:hypothetical protein n=1 Tax=Undibacterium sp. Ji50W TaxID=3413041 RepID=UPI003BF0E1CB